MVKRVTKLQKRRRCNALTFVDRTSVQTYAGDLIRMLKKRSFSILLLLFLSLVTAGAAEQGVVEHCATIIRDFRQMPEKGIPTRCAATFQGARDHDRRQSRTYL